MNQHHCMTGFEAVFRYHRSVLMAQCRTTRHACFCIAHANLVIMNRPLTLCAWQWPGKRKLQANLEQNLSSENVSNASHSCLVHEDGTNRLLADLHLLPQQLPVCICSQRVRPQLGCFLLVVICTIHTFFAEHCCADVATYCTKSVCTMWGVCGQHFNHLAKFHQGRPSSCCANRRSNSKWRESGAR